MNLAETAVVMTASVVTILTGTGLTARWVVRRTENWIAAVADNSRAVRDLTVRVAALEGAIGKG